MPISVSDPGGAKALRFDILLEVAKTLAARSHPGTGGRPSYKKFQAWADVARADRWLLLDRIEGIRAAIGNKHALDVPLAHRLRLALAHRLRLALAHIKCLRLGYYPWALGDDLFPSLEITIHYEAGYMDCRYVHYRMTLGADLVEHLPGQKALSLRLLCDWTEFAVYDDPPFARRGTDGQVPLFSKGDAVDEDDRDVLQQLQEALRSLARDDAQRTFIDERIEWILLGDANYPEYCPVCHDQFLPSILLAPSR
ncbi:hypothetical protein Q5752_004971 [Cryptotrichosporon argae]